VHRNPTRWSNVGQTNKLVIGAISAVLLLALTSSAQAQGSGADLFKAKCAVCHKIGQKGIVGPDLLGITEKRSEAWLIKYIKSPQAMVDAGDPDAKAAFAAYAPTVMPDQALTDAQIRSILAYVATGPKTASAGPRAEATDAQIELGKNLFQGLERFKKGGPTCTSCHDVQMEQDMVISGGVLATELTKAFSKFGAEGVTSVIRDRPYPIMQAAYADAPLTDEEVTALVAFLEKADKAESLAMPLDMGVKLLAAGVVGVVLLLGLYSLLWSGRKRESVNQEIFDRQVKSI
jgi:mono/diheme cytochrome c family protein